VSKIIKSQNKQIVTQL